MTQLYLLETLADASRLLPLDSRLDLPTLPGAHYSVLDADCRPTRVRLHWMRLGGRLLLRTHDRPLVQLQDFYAAGVCATCRIGDEIQGTLLQERMAGLAQKRRDLFVTLTDRVLHAPVAPSVTLAAAIPVETAAPVLRRRVQPTLRQRPWTQTTRSAVQMSRIRATPIRMAPSQPQVRAANVRPLPAMAAANASAWFTTAATGTHGPQADASPRGVHGGQRSQGAWQGHTAAATGGGTIMGPPRAPVHGLTTHMAPQAAALSHRATPPPHSRGTRAPPTLASAL